MNCTYKLFSALSLSLCLAVTSCTEKPSQVDKETSHLNTESEKTDTLKNIVKKVPTKYQEMVREERFVMNASTDFSATTQNGMKIVVPSNVLVDENNVPVKGEVNLFVSEYYSPAEIIVSNIPMQYMDGEELRNFQSDGMFNIHATQNGKTLKIADNKSISLTTKRNKEGEGFEFFALQNNKWVKDENNKVESITKSNKKLPILKKPKAPTEYELVKFNPNYYTIEKDQRSSLPEYNTDVHKKGFYEENTVKQINVDVRKNPWILDRSKWHFVKKTNWIFKKDDLSQVDFDTVIYDVLYAIRGNKKYQKLVADQNAAKTKYKEDLLAYNENYSARMEAGQLTVSEQTQKLVVNQFGTYNIDRFYHQSPRMIVSKPFNVSATQDLDPSDRRFLIVKDNAGGLVPIEIGLGEQNIMFSKAEKNVIIALSEDKVYALNQSDFKATAKAQLKDEQFRFSLKEELTFSTTEEFNELLEGLF